MNSPNRIVKVGCCGFGLARARYAQLFPVVEVQQTFYQPPRVFTLRHWRAEMPEEFEFTLKAWQLITHESTSSTYRRLKKKLTARDLKQCGAFRWTAVVREAWSTTLECARALSAGLVLFQCPRSFRSTEENIERMCAFFNSVEREALRLLWEPRGEWPEPLIRSLCRKLDLVHVVDPFAAKTLTPRLVYYRLHGIGGWRHTYKDEELQRLQQMLPANGPAYVLFNNAPMISDARRFQALLEQ